jgi:hypothetical protein
LNIVYPVGNDKVTEVPPLNDPEVIYTIPDDTAPHDAAVPFVVKVMRIPRHLIIHFLLN